MGALPEKTTLLLEQLCTFYVPKTDGDGKERELVCLDSLHAIL